MIFLLNSTAQSTDSSNDIQQLQYGLVYTQIKQGPKSFKYYSFQVQTVGYITQYQVIRVDAEDGQSDPDVFISKVKYLQFTMFQSNTNPTSIDESDQYCVRAGSELCIIKRSLTKINDIVYFSVKCISSCSYSLKIYQSYLKQLSDGIKQNLKLESRVATIIAYYIPKNLTTQGAIDHVVLTIQSYSAQSPISIYFSPTDDFSQLEERDNDQVTDQGKAIRVSNGDIGWCTDCFVYFVLKSYTATQYTALGKAYPQNRTLTDNTTFTYSFRAAQTECISYNVLYSVYDVSLLIKSFQSDINFQINARETRKNLTSQNIIMSSDYYNSKNYIIRSEDRQTYSTANGLFYICAVPKKDGSASFLSTQSLTNNKFNLIEDTLTTFILDTQDYIYFYFTSYEFTTTTTITITLQSNKTGFSIPRILYKVCQYQNANSCNLTEKQATTLSGTNTLTVLNGATNSSSNTRSATIDHNPSVCEYSLSCYYLFSIYNPELSGPMQLNLKLTLSQDITPIYLFQSYYGTLDVQSYQTFQIYFTPQQLSTYNISKLIIKLTSFIGRGDIYLSTTNKNPGPSDYEEYSAVLFPINYLYYDVSNKDLTTLTIYVSIYGYQATYYDLYIGATYNSIYPQSYRYFDYSFINTDLTQNQNQWIEIQQQQTQYEVTLTQETNSTTYYCAPQTNKSMIIKISKIETIGTDSSYFYSVSCGSQQWNNLNNEYFIIDKENFTNNACQIVIKFQGTFSGISTNGVSSSVLLSLIVYQANQFSEEIIDTTLNTTIEGYAFQRTVLFRRPLMDDNATYQFSMSSILDQPSLMVRSGNFQGYMSITDDTTYDYASVINEESQVLSINLDKTMRTNTNSLCKNGTYTVRGGNENCTIYIGVQCDNLCIFTFANAIVNGKNKIFSEPQHLKNGVILNGTVLQNQSTYFYIPFTKSQIGDGVILLSKTNNDSYIVAKVISNAYLPYYSWSYPSRTTYDYIVKNPSANQEVLELLNSTHYSKCTSTASCALIIGIVGNGNSKTTYSNFQVVYYNFTTKMPSIITKESPLSFKQYDYFWTIVNNSNAKYVQNQWNVLFTVKSNDQNNLNDIDIYASVINGVIPNSNYYNYKSTLEGADYLNITSNDISFKKTSEVGPKVLILFSLYVANNQTSDSIVSYTMMSWVCTTSMQQIFNFTDIYFSKQYLYNFQARNLVPNHYKMYRFLNYGSKDVLINITCYDGNVSIYINNQVINEKGSVATNHFFHTPLYQETSLVEPAFISKGQSYQLQIGKDYNETGLWCLFCYYYLAIYQNATKASQSSLIGITVSEIAGSGDYTQQLKNGHSQKTNVSLENTPLQYKFILATRELFAITLQNANNKSFEAYITLHPNYLNSNQIYYGKAFGNLTLRFLQSDTRFQIGTYYYLTVIALQSPQIMTVTFQQNAYQNILKSQETLLERMWTSNDFVKYYYLEQPLQKNFTAQVIVKSQKQGLIPTIYIIRNDFVNKTFNSTLLQYPNPFNYTYKTEASYYLLQNSTASITFNVTQMNVSVNVSQQVKVNVTMKNKTTGKNYTVTNTTTVNVSVPVLNQTFYTIAVYFTNFGYTNEEKTEFQISYYTTPLKTSLKDSSGYYEEENTEEEYIEINNDDDSYLYDYNQDYGSFRMLSTKNGYN